MLGFPELEQPAKDVDVSPHKWEFCVLCESFIVVCANCGNNCCSGGSGRDCPDKCSDAYSKQGAADKAIAALRQQREERRARIRRGE